MLYLCAISVILYSNAWCKITKNNIIMNKINFLIATLLMAIMPMLFTSCEPTPEPTPEATIIGTWECVDAILKQNLDPSGGESLSEKGLIWKFDETNKLTVNDKTYDYTLSNNTLTTSYAEIYSTDHFNVDSLGLNDLILSAGYVEETKVGNIGYTVTLRFKRPNK